MPTPSLSCELSQMEQSLNRNIEELSSTFDQMLQTPMGATTAVHATAIVPPTTTTSTVMQLPQLANPVEETTMDEASRMRAIKVFNVILARLWRRRCAQVCDLHELVRRCQVKANTMRDDLYQHNQMMCKELRRCNRLEMELRQVKYAAELSSQGCIRIENTLNVARRKEAKMRRELLAKTLECNSFAELLNATKTEMFRELSKFRQCAQDLAEQQRQNRLLEGRNAELEDELLTLKDRFQTQHDEIVLAFHLKQEKIDEAYEALKGYEQELAELELKHLELLKENKSEAILQEIKKMEHKLGIFRYVYCFMSPHRWFTNFRWMAHEIVALLMHRPLSGPALPATSVGFYLTVVLLISAIY